MGGVVNIIGESMAMRDIRRQADLIAADSAPVLITGETGTGKNMLARYIHDRGPRSQGPYVIVNCTALPEALIESELFGYERGAFTNAYRAKRGLFELAHGGTLVLDEIGDMPIQLQSRMLTVCDQQQVRRIGGETTYDVDVRIIATTNCEMEQVLRQRKFRKDLYYRLSSHRINIPPLRERTQDILPLTALFAEQASNRGLRLNDDDIEALCRYQWPGNVRELKSAVLRAAANHCDGLVSLADALPRTGAVANQPAETALMHETRCMTLSELKRWHIGRTLKECRFNKTVAARVLGISRSTLKRLIAEMANAGSAENEAYQATQSGSFGAICTIEDESDMIPSQQLRDSKPQ